MLYEMFFGLQCFEGGRTLPKQLQDLHHSLTRLIDSGCEDPRTLVLEMVSFEQALTACVTCARRQEEQMEALRPRMPRWMRLGGGRL